MVASCDDSRKPDCGRDSHGETSANDEARGVAETDFVSANQGLFKVMAMTPLGLLAALIGMVLA
jgi:hypothetical protein